MPPGFGSPYHVHHREDESFYVIEGEVAFVVDGQWHYAGPGTFVHGPRDIPHGFAVIGTRPARMLLLATPGGFEQFVLALRTPFDTTPEPPDMAALMAAAARHGVDILGPLPDMPDDLRGGRDDARADIDRLRATHIAALTANDAAGWTAIFAEDAVQLPPIGAVNTGTAAIGAFNERFMAMFAVSSFNITPMGLEVHGDVAIEHGDYTIVLTPHGAPAGMSDSGKYITTYRRNDAGGVADHARRLDEHAPPACRRVSARLACRGEAVRRRWLAGGMAALTMPPCRPTSATPMWPAVRQRGTPRPRPRCVAAWRHDFASMACDTCVPAPLQTTWCSRCCWRRSRPCAPANCATTRSAAFRAGHGPHDGARTAARCETSRGAARDLRRDAGARGAVEPEVDRERLGRCLQSLKERDRSVVMLTFYDDRAGSDVARFLGVSEANVRVIRHRAIRQLRGCMEGEVA